MAKGGNTAACRMLDQGVSISRYLASGIEDLAILLAVCDRGFYDPGTGRGKEKVVSFSHHSLPTPRNEGSDVDENAWYF